MLPNQTGYLPGAAQPAPMLGERALQTEAIPENFIAPIVFPDARVEDFAFIAPLHGNEALEAEDDDTIGRKGDLKEVMMTEGYYSAETGAHGRKVIIGKLDLMRARRAQRMAGGQGNEQFNLEARGTALILAQTRRHNELLAVNQLIDPDNYPASHVFDELDVVNAANVREVFATAANLVEDDSGRGPANLIIIGGGASRGLILNTNFVALLPDDAIKVPTPDDIARMIELPTGSRVVRATARVRSGPSGNGRFMMDNFIWIGRVDPAPRAEGQNESAPFIPNQRANSTGSFAWNFWQPVEPREQSSGNERYYVNRLVVGNQENVHIGVQTFYRPLIENPDWGVLIPTTPIEEALDVS